MNKKMAVTLVAAVMLLLLYCTIFSFSHQDADTSSGISHMISEKCVGFLNDISGKNWTRLFRQELVAYFENPIRKLAHFAEYAYMAVLVYIMWHPWLGRGRQLCCLVVAWVFLSGAGDEIHQLFVPGRYGCLPDVLLDTCGGVFGVLLSLCIEKILGLKRKTH